MKFVFAYWTLTLLYIVLLILFIWLRQRDKTTIQSWPLLPDPQSFLEPHAQNKTCQTDTECPAHHVCLKSQCVPKLLRGENCTADTGGKWIAYFYRKIQFAICACLKPDIFTQRLFGGDCNVNIACGAHGH